MAPADLPQRTAHGQPRLNRDAQQVEEVGELGLHLGRAAPDAPPESEVRSEEAEDGQAERGEQRQAPGQRSGERRAREQRDQGAAAFDRHDIGDAETERGARRLDPRRQVTRRPRRPQPAAEARQHPYDRQRHRPAARPAGGGKLHDARGRHDSGRGGENQRGAHARPLMPAPSTSAPAPDTLTPAPSTSSG